jgi:hypothetical protein
LEATVHGPGLFEENGGSTAEDVVSYCQLTLFDLSYTEAVAVVTTTEATTISAGHLWQKEHSRHVKTVYFFHFLISKQ